MFLSFTVVIKILQKGLIVIDGDGSRDILDTLLTEFNTVWLLFYLFCSSIVIHAVIVTTGTFEP